MLQRLPGRSRASCSVFRADKQIQAIVVGRQTDPPQGMPVSGGTSQENTIDDDGFIESPAEAASSVAPTR